MTELQLAADEIDDCFDALPQPLSETVFETAKGYCKRADFDEETVVIGT